MINKSILKNMRSQWRNGLITEMCCIIAMQTCKNQYDAADTIAEFFRQLYKKEVLPGEAYFNPEDADKG